MGHLLMSDKERHRKAWMAMVCEGKVTLNKAAGRFRRNLSSGQAHLSALHNSG